MRREATGGFLNKGIPSLIIFKPSIQEVTYIQAFKLWTFKDANLCPINVWRGETAACPVTITDDPSAVSSPTTSLASTQKPFLPVHSGPAPGSRLLSCTTVIFKAPCCQIKHIFFISMFAFRYYLYVTEKEMATSSSILAWKIPWMEEPGGLQSTGSQRVGHDWATSLHSLHTLSLEKEMATHSSFLAWRIPWTEEPGGPWSMGSQRVGQNWSDWAHYLYEKYYKPIIEQNDMVECISWEPRLTLLDL